MVKSKFVSTIFFTVLIIVVLSLKSNINTVSAEVLPDNTISFLKLEDPIYESESNFSENEKAAIHEIIIPYKGNYRFIANSEQKMSVSVIVLNENNENIKSEIGNISVDFPGGTSWTKDNVRNYYFLDKGKYYIKVSSKINGDYKLQAYSLTIKDEDNNSFEEADIIKFDTIYHRNKNYKNDVDYFKIDVPYKGEYRFISNSASETMNLEIMNSNHNVIKSELGHAVVAFPGGNKWSKDNVMNYYLLEKGVYFIKVTGLSERFDSYNIQAFSLTSKNEDSTTLEDASKIIIDKVSNGEINYRGDADYFAVNIPFMGEYKFITNNKSNSSTDVEVFDKEGNHQLTQQGLKVNSFPGNSYWHVNNVNNSYYLKKGTYYIKVTSSQNIKYTLLVKEKEYSYAVGANYSRIDKKDIDTRQNARVASLLFNPMGYINNLEESPSYSRLKDKIPSGKSKIESSVVYLNGHGNYNSIAWPDGKNKDEIYAGIYYKEASLSNNITNKYICLDNSNLDFSGTKLMIFSSCLSASSENAENLAQKAVENGVKTSIGYQTTVGADSSGLWDKRFLEALSTGNSVKESREKANNHYDYYDNNVLNTKIYGVKELILNPLSVTEKKMKSNEMSVNKEYLVEQRVEVDNMEEYIKKNIDSNFSISNYKKEVFNYEDNDGYIILNRLFNGISSDVGFRISIINGGISKIGMLGEEINQKSIPKKVIDTKKCEELYQLKAIEENKVDIKVQITEQKSKIIYKVSEKKYYCIVLTTYLDKNGYFVLENQYEV